MPYVKPDEMIDMFISDCLLPSTVEKVRANRLFEIFEAYCKQLEIGTPCSLIHFGRCLKKRFQFRRIDGRSHYFCEIKPNLIEEES